MDSPFTNFSVNWLNLDNDAKHINPKEQDTEWSEIYIPAIDCFCGTEALTLVNGITIFRAKHRFRNYNTNSFPLAEAVATFDGPALQIQSALTGSFANEEKGLAANKVFWGGGIDLIRFSDSISAIPWIFAPEESEFIAIAISYQMLKQYLGDDQAEIMILGFGLNKPQGLTTYPTPFFIRKILHGCIDNELRGSLKKLSAESKLIRYLMELCLHFNLKNMHNTVKHDIRSKNRAHKIKELIEKTHGKLSIPELVTHLECSARTLTRSFESEFQQSIFSFALDVRLNLALQAIRDSNIELKKISESVGYSHVSHFSVAFKRKFGYPPGALRK